MTKNCSVLGIYKSEEEARRATFSLQDFGLHEDQIQLIGPPRDGEKDFAVDVSNKMGRSILYGSTCGALIGLTFALCYIYIRGSSHPELSPWMFSFFCIALFALFGGFAAILVRIGTPDRLLKRYEHYLDDGGVLMCIHTDSRQQIEGACRIMEASGAAEVKAVPQGSSLRRFFSGGRKSSNQKISDYIRA